MAQYEPGFRGQQDSYGQGGYGYGAERRDRNHPGFEGRERFAHGSGGWGHAGPTGQYGAYGYADTGPFNDYGRQGGGAPGGGPVFQTGASGGGYGGWSTGGQGRPGPSGGGFDRPERYGAPEPQRHDWGTPGYGSGPVPAQEAHTRWSGEAASWGYGDDRRFRGGFTGHEQGESGYAPGYGQGQTFAPGRWSPGFSEGRTYGERQYGPY